MVQHLDVYFRFIFFHYEMYYKSQTRNELLSGNKNDLSQDLKIKSCGEYWYEPEKPILGNAGVKKRV